MHTIHPLLHGQIIIIVFENQQIKESHGNIIIKYLMDLQINPVYAETRQVEFIQITYTQPGRTIQTDFFSRGQLIRELVGHQYLWEFLQITIAHI